ncbi:hypothetical protein NG709_11940 [Gordonia amicalis]|nr:hypothetical protein [Gordonia amicalis]
MESVSAGTDPVASRDSAESFAGLREVACESLECASGCGDGAGIPEDEFFRVVRPSQFFLVGHGAHRIRDVISEVLDFDRDLLEPYCTETLADEIGGTVDESADEFPSALDDAEWIHSGDLSHAVSQLNLALEPYVRRPGARRP